MSSMSPSALIPTKFHPLAASNQEQITDKKFFDLIAEPLRKGDFKEVDQLSETYENRIQEDKFYYPEKEYENLVIGLLNNPQDPLRIAKAEKCLQMCQKHNLGIANKEFWGKLCAFENGHLDQVKDMRLGHILPHFCTCLNKKKRDTLKLVTNLWNHLLGMSKMPPIPPQGLQDPSTKV
ncbi:MAG: hypothetical protein KGJ02_07295 [Verrucomicrobiota bacterium]|nr:hypothetical protein [Verrucomicrobiota bacterium]